MTVSKFGMEEGVKNVTSPFIEVWMFEPQKCLSFLFGDSLSSKTHRENYTQKKVRFWTRQKKTGTRWAPTILQLLWLRVKEPNKNRPFIRDVTVTPSIGIWPTLYELLFFNFQGLSIHTFDGPLILQHLTSLIDDWGFATHPRWWALFIGQQQSLASMGMKGNGIFTYIFFRKSSTIHTGKYIQYMDGMGYLIHGDHTRFSRFSMYHVP